MTPDERLDRLDAELNRLATEHPGVPGILRLTRTALGGCSKWKWQQHGWKQISDADACGVMNGNDRELHTALLSLLHGRMIDKIEFVYEGDGADVLEVVPDLAAGA